jgi:hypothetical protein
MLSDVFRGILFYSIFLSEQPICAWITDLKIGVELT